VKLGATESHLNFVNTLPCDLEFTIDPELGTHSLAPFENTIFKTIEARSYEINISVNTTKGECKSLGTKRISFNTEAQKVVILELHYQF